MTVTRVSNVYYHATHRARPWCFHTIEGKHMVEYHRFAHEGDAQVARSLKLRSGGHIAIEKVNA